MLEDLKTRIEGYIGSRKGRSRLTLAQESGVSYNTITRILLNDCSPSLDSVLKLLKAICPENEALAFIDKHYPDLKDYIKQCTQSPASKAALHHEFSAALKGRTSFEILCLCARPNGSHTQEIYSLFGSSGLKNIEQLLNVQLLTEKNGRYFADTAIYETEEQLLASLGHVLSSLEERLQYLDKAHASVWSAGLNAEGLQAVLNILRNADIEIQRIRRNPDFEGEHAIQVGTMMSQINPSVLVEDTMQRSAYGN